MTHDDLDLSFASGAAKVMVKTLQEVSKPMAWPGTVVISAMCLSYQLQLRLLAFVIFFIPLFICLIKLF